MNLNLTLLGQSIGFIAFVLFCMKYVWPPVTGALRERQQRITDGLEASRRAERDLELAQEKVAAELKAAKVNAAEILEQANRRAGQIVDEAKDQARMEADRIRAASTAELEQAANQAREQLRAQLATLVVAGAERVLQGSVDQNAHRDYLNKLSAEL